MSISGIRHHVAVLLKRATDLYNCNRSSWHHPHGLWGVHLQREYSTDWLGYERSHFANDRVAICLFEGCA